MISISHLRKRTQSAYKDFYKLKCFELLWHPPCFDLSKYLKKKLRRTSIVQRHIFVPRQNIKPKLFKTLVLEIPQTTLEN